MKPSYLSVAQQAAKAEQAGDYLEASILWGQAKYLARTEKDLRWAEYRIEHNSLRNSLLTRAIEYEEQQKERNKKAREKIKSKKEAELLEANINKTSEVSCE
ncbi:ANR family transcriptional regulator [Providencia rettgeri]|uniref:ANR family transcriptional regulator n=1 Tax=Providencia rettgeri TaxID=587 RepID=UPI00206240A1|nr:ANR family transcriptional regulator [Providencia rettgeri]UPS64363.1 ANR family transcriptional regulator [Providencia rettgeri]